MILGILGDLHGEFDALERSMAAEPGVATWLSVGDVASDDGRYPASPRPLYFIKGNNEDFDVIARLAAGEAPVERLHLLSNGRLETIDGVRVLGLGGTFAPTWYETAPEDLPARRNGGAAAKADDKRRHFVRAEVEACKATKDVDLFLSHEAARPYWAGSGRGRNDAGKTAVNEILAAVRPRLHVFGHHHRFTEGVREGVPSIGLPLARDGYLVVDTASWTWELRRADTGV